MKCKIHIWLLFYLLLSLFSCSERKHDNIFDPDNDQTVLDMAFYVKQSDEGFVLSWNSSPYNNYDSIFIYKSYDSPAFTAPYAKLPSNIYTFTDSILQNHRTVYYAVSLFSDGNQSAKTSAVERVKGNGNITLLTSYGYTIYQMSFDMVEIINIIYTDNHYDHIINMGEDMVATTPDYGRISLFNFNSNREVNGLSLHGTGHVLYDPAADSIFCSSVRPPYTLYRIGSDLADYDSISIGEYPSIALFKTAEDLILYISANTVYVLSKELTIMDSLSFGNNAIINAQYANGLIYIILQEGTLDSRSLMTISPDDLSVNSLFSCNGNVFTVIQDTIWIEEYGDILGVDTKLVKLLHDGSRLCETGGFSNITGLSLNKSDDCIYVIERYADTVHLLRTDGTLLISKSGSLYSLYDPVEIIYQND